MDRKKAHEINGACCWWEFDRIGLSDEPRPLPAWTLDEMKEAARVVRDETTLGVVQEDGSIRRQMHCFCDDRVLERIAERQSLMGIAD